LARKIRRKVEVIIGDGWEKTNAHGVDLRERLIEPELVKHDNKVERQSDDEPEFIYLWVVLREWPDGKRGYSIVCDSAVQNFGLALAGLNMPILLGWHGGGFWGTFNSM